MLTDVRTFIMLMRQGCFSHFHVRSFKWNPRNGAKNSEQRIPGLLSCNAHGRDKVPPLVTGKSKVSLL